jgi:hypothetical protein
MSLIDNHGYVLAPVPVAPVNETGMVLFPESLKALKEVVKEVGLDRKGAYLNLDGGFDSTRNRKMIFNAGMIPNIKENPRNRKAPQRGRKRLFNEVIHALRMRVERTFAWEDKFKRLLLRFERIPTVCLDVTSLVASSYEYDSDTSGPTRCAIIDAALGDR